jgi:chaperonin GroEL
MSKTILFNEEARIKLKSGADAVANAVKVSLGCSGKTVIISHYYRDTPTVTKDGYTIAKDINLTDEIENIGAEMMKGVSAKTVEDAGDGTTTATVLAQSILNEGLKMVAAGANSMDLKRGIDKAVSKVVDNIQSMAISVNNDINSIKNVAIVSANNDTEIGGLIAEAFEKAGNELLISIEESQTAETSINVVSGIQIERGYINQHFITNHEKGEAVLENPYIIVTDAEISYAKEIIPILEEVINTQRPVLIICGDIQNEALSFITLNKVKGGLKIAATKPSSAYRNETLDDIAVVTGATVISEITGCKLENATLDMLGTAEKVILTQGTTTIIGGYGSRKAIDTKKAEIKALLAEEKIYFNTERLKKRVAKLSGGVAIMYVGAMTEVELKEKKDRVDDAVKATKAAVEEGIVPGGGVALIKSISCLIDLKGDNEDENIGINIIKKALEAPLKQILENCGIKDSFIINKIKSGEEVGYNARSGKFESLIDSGIIDPAKVVRCALQNAASVASMIMTSECLIGEVQVKK